MIVIGCNAADLRGPARQRGTVTASPAGPLRLRLFKTVARLLGGGSRNDAARYRAKALKTIGVGAFVRHAQEDDSEGFLDVGKIVGVLGNVG